MPWVIIGDFNCVLLAEERSSRSAVSSSFKSRVDSNGLIDLGYFGSCYTWSHGASVETRQPARLDRAISCDAWRRLFPGASVHHLTHAYSDHSLVLLDLNGAGGGDRLGERPFSFLASWMLHDKFFQWTEKEWAWTGDLTCL